ncbi:hypothetical protein [Heliobacterium mobile]|nr:hypothetical protein [Heliobacterium mobile]
MNPILMAFLLFFLAVVVPDVIISVRDYITERHSLCLSLQRPSPVPSWSPPEYTLDPIQESVPGRSPPLPTVYLIDGDQRQIPLSS